MAIIVKEKGPGEGPFKFSLFRSATPKEASPRFILRSDVANEGYTQDDIDPRPEELITPNDGSEI